MGIVFSNNDKSLFIRNVDHLIGLNDLKGLDDALFFLIHEKHSFTEDFIKFIMAYMGAFNRDLKNWDEAYSFLNKK